MQPLVKTSLLTAILALTALQPATAGDNATMVKTIVDGAKNAIMQVEIVWEIKVTYRGQEQPAQETKVQRNGVVIDKDGLTVLSASSVTPSGSARNRGIKIDANPQSVKFILDDGTEIPAEIVLKDKDLDIMYVKPSKAAEKPFSFLKLEKDVPIKVLDTVVTMSRLGTDENRTVLYYSETINGIVEKPKKHYVANYHAPGMPAFTMDGKCFGLFLKRKGSGSFRLLPADDILESAAQLDEE